MFSSKPPALTLYSRRASKIKKLSLAKLSPPASPTCPLSPSISAASVELSLLSTLQGVQLSCDEKHRIVSAIELMNSYEKDELIEFLQANNGAAPSAMENNACKQFLCNTTQLCSAHITQDPKAMMSLWNKLYLEIIPGMQSILYPLQRYKPGFDIRRTILTSFRDRVLAKVLKDVDVCVPELQGMLFTIMLETEDSSALAATFSVLVDRVMGTTEKAQDKQESEFLSRTGGKVRSRTLPNKASKSVTWQDLRKSATFSN